MLYSCMSKRPPGTDPEKQPASREQVQDTGRKSTIFFPPPPPGLEVQKEGSRVPGAMPSEGTGTNNGAIRNQGLSSHLSGSQYTGSYYGGGSEDGDVDDVDTKLLPIQLLSTLSFRYKDQGRRKAEAIFIPKGVQVNSKKIESLVTETWGLSMPNMIIACDAGSAHPVTLATKALCQGNAFRQWASEARAQTASKKDDLSTAVDGSKGMLSQKSQPLHLRASRQSKALHSIKPPHDGSKSGQVELQELFPAESEANVSQKDGTDGSLGDEAISVINQLLYQKLVTVYSAVLDAAQMSNNWIIVDRTKGGSPTAELLLEMAMAQVDTRPVVVVIDRASRLKHYHSTVAANQLEYILDMARASTPVGADTGVASTPQTHVCPSSYSLYDCK